MEDVPAILRVVRMLTDAGGGRGLGNVKTACDRPDTVCEVEFAMVSRMSARIFHILFKFIPAERNSLTYDLII